MADRWLTFDCFGTLIDWRHGITTTGELLFPGRGRDFLNAYVQLEAEVTRVRGGDRRAALGLSGDRGNPGSG